MNQEVFLTGRPRYANSGFGPSFAVLDIGLPNRVAVVEPDSAYWAVVDTESLPDALSGQLLQDFLAQREAFEAEMQRLRFGLKPSAVYFNPTERCNFNCTYCYLPEDMRRNGTTMTPEEVAKALECLAAYFERTLEPEATPQLIFHGSEPMLAREAIFSAIDRFRGKFLFGIQTNATLLDDEAIDFLTSRGVGIGISLDAHEAGVADKVRKNWHGQGAFARVRRVMDRLAFYPAFNVITTVTRENVALLPELVDFYHDAGVGVVMFNPVRCTRKGGVDLKPNDAVLAEAFCAALDRTYALFEKTARKLVVANFANVLAGVVGPTGRRLMCDISPCGGGRCFFAVSAQGDLFPCSEFIGFPEYRGGNLFRDDIAGVLESRPFQTVTGRMVEKIEPCRRCAVRHFCGAPCPAEVQAVSGRMEAPSPYCQFYEEQVRYAFRVVAQGREAAYLWNGWDSETEETYRCA